MALEYVSPAYLATLYLVFLGVNVLHGQRLLRVGTSAMRPWRGGPPTAYRRKGPESGGRPALEERTADMAERSDIPTTVVIADDHALTRAGIQTVLEGAGFAVVGEAGDATEAVAVAVRERPDVVLLDVHMPGNGIRAARRITKELPDVAVVMVTVSGADEDLLDAFRAGAVGYLPKDMDLTRLPDALRGVLAGQAAVPREFVARVLNHLRETGRTQRIAVAGRPGVTLTSREVEVADLLREKLTTSQMAQRLFVSPATVRSHLSAILRKLGVESREEAVALLKQAR